MKQHRIHIKQTLATLICDEKYLNTGLEEIIKQRQILEDFIEEYPAFASSFTPLEVGPDAPEIILRMSEASTKAGVGPMAAVAGAIAEYGVKAIVKAGSRHVIMDNGGDIAMKICKPVIVGVYSGKSRMRDIGLKIIPREYMFGICTSSGTIGHSFSHGCADSVTVISRDVLLADAMATALGNDIRQRDEGLIEEAIKRRLIDPVSGMMVVAGDIMGRAGEIPRLVRARFDINRINLG